MKVSKMISVVDTHTAGEAARLIVGGIPKFHGKTMADKKYTWKHKQMIYVKC